MSASLTFDGRLHCSVHTDVALAHVIGGDRFVCVVCRSIRATELEAMLNAGNDFDWPTLGEVLHYIAQHYIAPWPP